MLHMSPRIAASNTECTASPLPAPEGMGVAGATSRAYKVEFPTRELDGLEYRPNTDWLPIVTKSRAGGQVM